MGTAATSAYTVDEGGQTMTMGRFGFLAGALALVLFGLPGVAMAITADTSGSIVFQQAGGDDPCIIGDPSCKQKQADGDSLVYTSRSSPAAGGIFDLFTPVYLASGAVVDATTNKIPTSFTLGIDENVAVGGGSEVLQFFKTYVATGCTAGTLAGGSGDINTAPAGCTLTPDLTNTFTGPLNIPDNHNGSGFSDMLLNGFSLTAGTLYVFEARWTNDTDGMEEWFIIPAGTPSVPEPATLLLLGTGLVGLAAWGRKRFHR